MWLNTDIYSDSTLMRLESAQKLVYFSTFSLISVQKFKFATAPVRVNGHMYNIVVCSYSYVDIRNVAEQVILGLHTLNYS